MKSILALITAFSFFSCSKTSHVIESTVFENTDSLNFNYNSVFNCYYYIPGNYKGPLNSEKKYPLAIYLHGGGGAGNLTHLDYLGYNTGDGKDDLKAKSFQINHPSFVLVPQTSASVWNTNQLIRLIEEFKKQFRIDTNRIYLIGYSMGGSGSYLLANAYFDYNKQLFAGIIRLAGQSQTVVRKEIAEKTSIWLHIGLDDTEVRISVTRDAYKFLKNYNVDAFETFNETIVSGYSGSTLTLKRNNKEIVKKTEYNNVGHGISYFPFNDGSLIEWLYSQSIE